MNTFNQSELEDNEASLNTGIYAGLKNAPAPTDFHRLVYCILGLPIDALSFEQATRSLHAAARQKRRCFLSTPNLNFVIWSHVDAEFRDSVIRSDLVVADGMPLVWVAAGLGIPLSGRVAGSSLFERLRSEIHSSISIYFFGGPDGIASQAATSINGAKYGLMKCVGFESPGFGTIEEMSAAKIIDGINSNSPDFVVVALGAKKGQRWIEHNLPHIKAPIISHLGAVMNMVAGKISRAPKWMQNCGLEWLWRIKEEPALWRRYINDGRALLSLLLTRVAPAIFYQRSHGLRQAERSGAEFLLLESAGSVRLVLRGAWSETNLSPLRKVLTQIAALPRDVVLDLGEVSHVDCAFLGLCILLYGHQSKTGRQFRIERIHGRVRKIFKANCADYLWRRQAGVAAS